MGVNWAHTPEIWVQFPVVLIIFKNCSNFYFNFFYFFQYFQFSILNFNKTVRRDGIQVKNKNLNFILKKQTKNNFFFFFYLKNVIKPGFLFSTLTINHYNKMYIKGVIGLQPLFQTPFFNINSLFNKFFNFFNIIFFLFTLNFSVFFFGSRFFSKEVYVLNKRIPKILTSFKTFSSFFFSKKTAYNFRLKNMLRFLKKNENIFCIILDFFTFGKTSNIFRKFFIISFSIIPFNISQWSFFFSIPVQTLSYYNQLFLLHLTLSLVNVNKLKRFKTILNLV